MNTSDSVFLVLLLVSIIGIFVSVNTRAYLYYKYLMLQKGNPIQDFLDFLFSNKNILLKLQVSLPIPLLFKNENAELEILRKRINKQTIMSYLCIALLFVIRFFFIEG